MDTKDLFERVINTRGVYSTLGVTENTVKQLRISLRNDAVSIDKMHEILKRAGYRIAVKEEWEKC